MSVKTNPAFKLKSELRRAVEEGKPVLVFRTDRGPVDRRARQLVDGPGWFATVEVRDLDDGLGLRIVKVVS